MRSDFRLWEYIFKALNELASRDLSNVAFQIALCHFTGFGTPVDNQEANRWLERCGRSIEDLQKEVDLIRADLNPMIYRNLETEISPLFYLYYYQSSEKLADIEKIYDACALNAEDKFGETHPITVFSYHLLGLIRMSQQDYEGSYLTLAKTARLCEESLGLNHLSTVTAINDQLRAAKLGKKYRECDQLGRKLVDARRKRPKPEENRSTMAGLAQLASGYTAQMRWWEADEADQQRTELMIATIKDTVESDAIARTLEEMMDHKSQKRKVEVQKVGEKFLEEVNSCLGEEHPTALIAMDLVYLVLEGNWKVMEGIARRSMHVRQKVLGPEHPDTLRDRNDLAIACLYADDGRLWEALQMLADAIEVEQRVLGYKNGHTLRAMGALTTRLGLIARDLETDALSVAVKHKAQQLDPEWWELEYPDTAL
jgi:hypothetical protein